MTDRTVPADLLAVEKPARYIGGEIGSIRKGRVDCRFVLAFPDVYEVGMSHLGFQILYAILNAVPWIGAERVYAPWPDREKQLRERGEPLSTLESGTPLRDADIVGFTLQYELSYTNLLAMLELSGIPLFASERDERFPLLVGGGPCASNPEPLADFFDIFLVGDGEEAVVEIAERWREWKRGGGTKGDLLRELCRIPGVYVPSFFRFDWNDDGTIGSITPLVEGYDRVRRRILPDLESAPWPVSPIVPFLRTVHDRVSLEICRGCTRGCRFCQAGYLYRPVRERSIPRLRELAAQALRNTGGDELSLLSLSTGDYSGLVPLLGALMADHQHDRVALSLPSVRVGTLTPELVEEIRRVRKTGFTMAPEAGSERLRRVINKEIGEEELMESARAAFAAGWRSVKLYFMIGLPTETDDDVAAIADLAGRVKRLTRELGVSADVTASVSTFVPKPHTPFQWEGQISYEETLRKQEMLRELLAKRKVRFKWHDAPLSVMEGVFARGDRRLSRLLLAARRRGCSFDGWSERFNFSRWLAACDDAGLDPRFYLRPRSTGEILPWEPIDIGVSTPFLLRERKLAEEGVYTGDCRTGRCTGCGVCDFVTVSNRIAPPPPELVTPAAEGGDRETRRRLRVRYARLGRMALLSHLEVVNLFSRAVARAGIPIRFSQGFHPHPRFSFASPSPVGIESRAEYLDMEIGGAMAADEVFRRLEGALPGEVEVLEVTELPPGAPSIDASTRGVVYRIDLPDGTPLPTPEEISRFLARDSVPHRRGNGREIDLRREFISVSLEGNSVTLAVRRGKPLEYLAALTGKPPERFSGARVVKLELLFTPPSEDHSHGP